MKKTIMKKIKITIKKHIIDEEESENDEEESENELDNIIKKQQIDFLMKEKKLYDKLIGKIMYHG